MATIMNADMNPILDREELDARSVESTAEEKREARPGSDRSLQEGLIRWMGTRVS